MSEKLNHYIEQSTAFFNRYKKYAPLILFFGGFTWDSITLTRIDRVFDNVILFLYFLLTGIFILLSSLHDKNRIKKPILLKYSNYYSHALQFTLGALFSAYVVFYFKSAALTKNWLFFGILVLLLVANEFLENRLTNLYLVFSLYFLAAFSFLIFFIPVVTKKMTVFTFLAGGVLSFLYIVGFIYLLYRKAFVITKRDAKLICLPVGTLFLLLNLFYYLNWIPPVPLSLKSGAIYHHVKKINDQYEISYEKPKWFKFWKKSDNPFHYAEGDTVFCFTSIFAPTQLRKNMIHHWQKYFPNRKEWVSTDRISYVITGGREGGFRGLTYKVNVSPGKWRIDVETEQHQMLGRIGFKIEQVQEKISDLTVIMK